MTARSGEEHSDLEARQEPRLVKALEMVAPGSALREGIDNIVDARTGGLICTGDPEDIAFLFSGGIKLDIDYTPALLYQLAKMDGAITLNANATKITMANVQLMPDPTILSMETGTRHRTAERVSKQTDALVIAVSQRREVVSLYVDGTKYILEDITVVLAKANQALATLDKYRTRLDQVSTRLTALEFEGGATLHDVLTVLQRSELVTRMAVEIERYIVELGTEGRLIEMQLEETMVGTAADKAALVHDYLAEDSDEAFAAALDLIGRLPHQDLLDFGRLAELMGYDRKLNTLDYPVSPRGYRILGRIPVFPSSSSRRSCASSAGSTSSWPPRTRSWRPSRAWERSVRRTSARDFAGCRRSTSWTATCRPDRRRAGRSARKTFQGGHHSRDKRAAPRGLRGARDREHRVRVRRPRRLPASRGRQGPQEGAAQDVR
jgi:diadenylate cyclase